jgi:putative tryptophan/tyrosine transport system substrate-binding protein
MPVIGFLGTSSEAQARAQVVAFQRGLGEMGFADGKNVAIEFCWPSGHYDRLPAMAAELVSGGDHCRPSPPPALSAKAATSAIAIVFVVGFDPATAGLVASLNGPGGNVTGVTLMSVLLGQKRLEMLRELAPKAAVVAMLVNPG